MDSTAERSSRSGLRWAVVVLVVAALGAAACRPTRPPGTTTTTVDPGGPTTTTDPGGGGGSLPPVQSTAGNGPYAAMTELGGGNRVFRPRTLGENGVKHPIFVWGTGAGATPDRYNDHFTQMASHGFVIVSPNKAMKAGTDMRAAYNWIVQQGTSGQYAGKLDLNNIAMGGHSQGSIATFDVEATLRLKTTIHIAGGSFNGQGSSNVKVPSAYMCGGANDVAKPQCDTDFRNMRAGGPPLYYAVLTGVGHIDAARRANPAMIAWLRWHLAGETKWIASFNAGGTFSTGIFQVQRKNWNY